MSEVKVDKLDKNNKADKLNTPIAVLGAGSWGSALALLLARNGNDVKLWDINSALIEDIRKQKRNQRYLPEFEFPTNISLYTDLAQCIAGVQDILIVVPSHAFRSLLEQLKKLKNNDPIRIVWGTKGFDPGTRELCHQVCAEVFSPKTPMAALSGPSFAYEVAAQQPTAASLAGNDEKFMEDLIERFHNTKFRIYKNPDLIGVQVFSAVKNVIAIAVGVADGLELGANTRAALITRGLVEMSRLAVALGGDAKTALSLAGVGDLVLTCSDNQSRNRRFGLAISHNQTTENALKDIGQSVEGLNNVRQVYDLAKSLHIEMPIVEQVFLVLNQGVSVKEAINTLLSRAPATEG